MISSAMATSASSAVIIFTRSGMRPSSRRRFPHERSIQDAEAMRVS